MPNKTITFGADLLPVESLTYNLGSSDKQWNIYGTLTGNAQSASAANITSTTNAISIYTDAEGTFGSVTSASGALYATTANGSLTFGILPVAQGGSGTSSMTAYGVAYGRSDTTALNFTNAGTTGYPLIGDGTNAPKWYGGLILKGTGADSYTANFAGTTNAISTTQAAVTISGGLGISQSMFIGGNILPSTTSVAIGAPTTTNRQIKAVYLINGSTTAHGIVFRSSTTSYGQILINSNSQLQLKSKYSIEFAPGDATAGLIMMAATGLTAGYICPSNDTYTVDVGSNYYKFHNGYFFNNLYSANHVVYQSSTTATAKVSMQWNDTDSSLDFVFS